MSAGLLSLSRAREVAYAMPARCSSGQDGLCVARALAPDPRASDLAHQPRSAQGPRRLSPSYLIGPKPKYEALGLTSRAPAVPWWDGGGGAVPAGAAS